MSRWDATNLNLMRLGNRASTSGLLIRDLPRGGRLLEWGDLVMQLGCYPETIKDTMNLKCGVPDVFLLTEELFDMDLGISLAELEFPVYYNYYVLGKKTKFVCRPRQLKTILRLLREAVFGPSSYRLEREFEEGAPDLDRECRYFKVDPEHPRGRLHLKDLVDPILFSEEGVAQVQDVTVTIVARDRYRLERGEEARELFFRPLQASSMHPSTNQRYRPPMFGITVIGSGHGFDARTKTSGFLIWINGRGILVDPPVNTTHWLKANGIDSRLVEDVVLTHCHADHDAGTLQKLFEEGRINLHTTPTVKESFVRKYHGLLNLSLEEFCSLFDFEPVYPGEPRNICTGDFTFHYTFHPVPTLGFSLSFLGKSFAYSCDTLYDPEALEQIRKEGWLSDERCRELCDFPDADLILHEAGLPPIHTPLSALNALPEETRSKIFLTHITEAELTDSDLRLAPTGVENTLGFEDLPEFEVGLAQRMLEVLVHVDPFEDLKLKRGAEFLRIAELREYGTGEVVIRTGDPGDAFYIVLSGEAEIIRDGRLVNIAGRYDYFGEMALVLNQPRAADIVARTELQLLRITRREFLRFISTTNLPDVLRRVAKNRMHGSWPLLTENRTIQLLSTFQKTQLVALMEYEEVEAGVELFSPGQTVDKFYLIDEGHVRMELEGKEPKRLRRGDLLGCVGIEEYRTRAVTETQANIFKIERDGLHGFFRSNPGTFVRMLASSRRREYDYFA